MSFNVLKEVKSLDKVLSARSWKIYLDLQDIVRRSNLNISDNDIPDLLRSGNVSDAYARADLLGKQKYLTAASHFAANQQCALVKKYPFPQKLNPFDPESEARMTFFSAENACRIQNRKMVSAFSGYLEDPLSRMRHFIQYVLGDAPDIGSVLDQCDFGPGANVGIHGDATNVAKKLLSDIWTVTPSALDWACSGIKRNFHLTELISARNGFVCLDPVVITSDIKNRMKLITYNKIAFVPKTAKTKRSIAVEPLWNSFLQKGTDLEMRKRLKRIGIDLSDQSANSRYAQYGSLDPTDNGFATIDLKSASDSISVELARSLLPFEWFRWLDSIRSKQYMLDGNISTYHKFCSMGNGFCFPLETLIFAAACHSLGAKVPMDFLVYGDDIAIRQRYAKDLISLLEELGFATNSEKTFIEGPFRESCGRDWFLGEDVRPFILDFALDSLQALFKFLNLTLRNSRTALFFSEARDYIESLIPNRLRFVRPFVGQSDTGYTVEFDQFLSSPYAKYQRDNQRWSWVELRRTPIEYKDWKRHEKGPLVLLYGALRGSPSSRPFTFRRKTRAKVSRVTYSSFMEGAYQ